MTFSWDFNTATLLAIVTQAVLVIIGLVRSDNRSKSAKELATDAKKRADEAHDKIAMQGETHALFREQVAREYVSREALREMEERLTHSIDGIRERLDKVLDHRQGK
jgi:hypothetical protein